MTNEEFKKCCEKIDSKIKKMKEIEKLSYRELAELKWRLDINNQFDEEEKEYIRYLYYKYNKVLEAHKNDKIEDIEKEIEYIKKEIEKRESSNLSNAVVDLLSSLISMTCENYIEGPKSIAESKDYIKALEIIIAYKKEENEIENKQKEIKKLTKIEKKK